jgi:hypothetical protein
MAIATHPLVLETDPVNVTTPTAMGWDKAYPIGPTPPDGADTTDPDDRERLLRLLLPKEPSTIPDALVAVTEKESDPLLEATPDPDMTVRLDAVISTTSMDILETPELDAVTVGVMVVDIEFELRKICVCVLSFVF